VTLAPERRSPREPRPAEDRRTASASLGRAPARTRVGAYPWAMAGAVTLSVAGAALSLNGVLRGWAWYLPVLTTVVVVCLTLAVLRALRAQPLLVAAGGFASLVAILTLTFFRSTGLAGLIPSAATMTELDRLIRRASETVLGESAPVAPNAGIVMVTCAALGLAVILIDALAVPLGMPATTGLGLLAIMVVPAMVKPQSVGVWGFCAAAAGYLLILACSQWFAPDSRTSADSGRTPGHLRRAVLTGAVALVAALTVPLAIPGFNQGTFPEGSRLNPWGPGTGLNPMITLGNSLRTPAGTGRITYATSASGPLYLRSVTVDNFDGDTWGPDDRDPERRPVSGLLPTGYDVTAPQQLEITVVDTGTFTSPYLPLPYAPQSIRGLNGTWTWDPATLSVKGLSTNTRAQQYIVASSAPEVTAAMLRESSQVVRGIPAEFTRIPDGVPDIVRRTAGAVTGSSDNAYAKAMAIQNYLRSGEFTYSLQSPVQGGYDGNGLSVLADFLTQKSGYCIHFASAMAVMARLEGIPSRIAVGFAPGRATGASVSVAGQGALPEYEVDARDAHAWPELYFQGLGWVPFEPTPSRGVVPGYATGPVSPDSPDLIENNNDLLSNASIPAPTPSAGPAPLPDASGSSIGQLLMPWLPGVAGVLGLLLILALPRLVRTGIRSRRIQRPDPDTGDAVPLAWAELRDLGADYGLPPQSSDTARAYSARLRRSPLLGEPGGLDDDAHQAVLTLTADFERRSYGRPGVPRVQGGNPERAALRISAVQQSLRDHASLGRRLQATWLPASVLGRWAGLLAAPFRGISRVGRRALLSAVGWWAKARRGGLFRSGRGQ
jgi:transglutaminase-like putative cysteine protease